MVTLETTVGGTAMPAAPMVAPGARMARPRGSARGRSSSRTSGLQRSGPERLDVHEGAANEPR
jgi:hypothetical protein